MLSGVREFVGFAVFRQTQYGFGDFGVGFERAERGRPLVVGTQRGGRTEAVVVWADNDRGVGNAVGCQRGVGMGCRAA